MILLAFFVTSLWHLLLVHFQFIVKLFSMFYKVIIKICDLKLIEIQEEIYHLNTLSSSFNFLIFLSLCLHIIYSSLYTSREERQCFYPFFRHWLEHNHHAMSADKCLKESKMLRWLEVRAEVVRLLHPLILFPALKVP